MHSEIIVTNHEVIQNFIMRTLNTPRGIPVKSQVTIDDVRGKTVYSEHSLPKAMVEAAEDVYVLRLERKVNFKKCSEIDLLVAIPSMVSKKRNDEDVILTSSKIERAYLGEEPTTVAQLLEQLQNAKNISHPLRR